MSEATYDVFISYSHCNSNAAKALFDHFKTHELRVFLDTEAIPWGAPIVGELEKALGASKHTVCLLSPAYVNSGWAQMERWAIQTTDANATLRKLLPILIEDCDIPLLLRPLRYLDCRTAGSLAACLPRMVSALRGMPFTPSVSHGSKHHIEPLNFIFVVGNPAAGKSTVCCHIKRQLEETGVRVELKGDFPFLQALFRMDVARGRSDRFESHPVSEFRVIDDSVYDDSLRLIHEELFVENPPLGVVTIIEFSRPSYDTSFLCYTLKALTDSAIIYIDAPLNVCIGRNERRRIQLERQLAGSPASSYVFGATPDVHYTPPTVMERYRLGSDAPANQSLVLSLMPARAYARICNNIDDPELLVKRTDELVRTVLLPLIQSSETYRDYCTRRFAFLEEIIASERKEH